MLYAVCSDDLRGRGLAGGRGPGGAGEDSLGRRAGRIPPHTTRAESQVQADRGTWVEAGVVFIDQHFPLPILLNRRLQLYCHHKVVVNRKKNMTIFIVEPKIIQIQGPSIVQYVLSETSLKYFLFLEFHRNQLFIQHQEN